MKTLTTLLLLSMSVITVAQTKDYMNDSEFYENPELLLIKTEILEKEGATVLDLKTITFKWAQAYIGDISDKMNGETDNTFSVFSDHKIYYKSGGHQDHRMALLFEFKDGKVRLSITDHGQVSATMTNLYRTGQEKMKDPFYSNFKHGIVKRDKLILAESYLDNVATLIKNYTEYLAQNHNDW